MALRQEEMNTIVQKVLERLQKGQCLAGSGDGIFATVDEAVAAATKAQRQLVRLPYARRGEIIEAMRRKAREWAETLAQMAVEETKMGRVEDKIIKNHLCIDKTPGIEDLSPNLFSGDYGITTEELAPFGVICSITPTTNPAATVINNGIGMVAAGNGVVFSPHPGAKNVTNKTIAILNQAIQEAGGPPNLLSSLKEPTIQLVGELMNHPGINMIVATGGMGVVKAALSSGKKAIGAGCGNPPVVVDETADLKKAAKDIVAGASFDNNLPCVCEKELLVVEEVADYLLFAMTENGAYEVEGAKLKELEQLLVRDGKPNRDYIGKDASVILQGIGIKVPKETRLVVAEVHDKNHPFIQLEMMMPVLAMLRVKNVQEAIRLAVEVEHGFRHTAGIHSKNVDNMTTLAQAINTTIFVKNAPFYSGLGANGEGHATMTVAGPTGEGLTSARNFTRRRRCVLVDGFSINKHPETV